MQILTGSRPRRREIDAGGTVGNQPQRGCVSTVLRLLARHTSFAEDEILGLEAFVEPGHICLDIGAEYGLYTHVLTRLVGPSGAVHSIEPLPRAFRLLSAGLCLSCCRNARLYRVALGERAERSTLSVPWRRGLPVHGRAFLTTGAKGQGPNAEFASSRAVDVDVLTLDELCAQEHVDRVDFVKVDVEGAELAVLRGGQAMLARCHPTLLLEIEARHLSKYRTTPAEVVSWLATRGYSMRIWRDGVWQTADQVTTAGRNYLFVHPDRARRTARSA